MWAPFSYIFIGQQCFEIEEDLLFHKLSNLILRRCEEWACSETFYKNKILPNESSIIEIVTEAADSIDEDKEIDFNLFN